MTRNTDYYLDRTAIDQLEKRYRANLINSLSGYKSANLVGTVNAAGQTNLALVSSVFHVGANPPLMGMLIRPHTVARHTLENIMEQRFYTINAVTEDIYQQAHQSSARYDRDASEFEATGLMAEFRDTFNAPYVGQSTVKTGLELVSTQTLDVNATVLVIGEIKEIRTEATLLADDGQLDVNRAGLVAVSGLDEYHTGRSLERLAYAKA